jgi:Protein of unknown function (DUF3224)
MTTNAKGSFDVKMTPQTWSESGVDHTLGRFMLDKQYHGDLEATSQGQMLSAGTGEKGSSGVYVAIEKVTGSLNGRKGSFVLYHTGIMNRGVPELSIKVVPDSGTGEFTGLAGSMTIAILDGKHSYEFAYSLVTVQ